MNTRLPLPELLKLSDEEKLAELSYIVDMAVQKMTQRSNLWADDLRSAGTLALWDAITTYSNDQSKSLLTFAHYRVNQRMIDFLRKVDHKSRRYRQMFQQYGRAASELRQELKREPKPEEVLAKAKLKYKNGRKKSQVMFSMMLTAPESLDQSFDENEDPRIVLKCPSERPGRAIEREEWYHLLHQTLEELPWREQLCLRLVYFQDWNQSDVAKKLKLTESRISQIIRKTLPAIRQKMSRQSVA